jgi:hypothetical protein
VRGDQPDLAAYVRRAGDDGDELARLIDVFLRVAPAPEPREDDVAVMHARLQGEPGLLALRRRRARKVDDVVADLAERLRVDDVPRLKRYYQRLEGGTLDPRPVDERVWEALRELFVTNVRAIVRPLTTRTGESAMAYYRRGGKPSAEILASAAPSVETQELLVTRDTSAGERDELDRPSSATTRHSERRLPCGVCPRRGLTQPVVRVSRASRSATEDRPHQRSSVDFPRVRQA